MARHSSLMFSSDIAYSDSPAASRVSASLAKVRYRTHFFSRHSVNCHTVCSKIAPLAPRVAAKVHAPNGYVTEVSYLLDLRAEVGGDGEPALPPVSDTVMAAIGAPALQLRDAREPLDLGVGEREQSIEVAPVECAVRLVEQLHVLLRHRLLSIRPSEQRGNPIRPFCAPATARGGPRLGGGRRPGVDRGASAGPPNRRVLGVKRRQREHAGATKPFERLRVERCCVGVLGGRKIQPPAADSGVSGRQLAFEERSAALRRQ